MVSSNRKVYPDVLRIIAILFVMYMHTDENGYYLYAFNCPFVLKLIYIATTAFVSVAVPIFFMISGAFLIGKEETVKELYRKRVLRIVIVLVVFTLIQYAYHIWAYDFPLDIVYFLENTIGGSIPPSYWYLYAYLAYLISLPLIRKLALSMSNRDYRYLFIVYLIVEGLFPTLAFLLGVDEINGFFLIPFLNRVIIFPLLGYYMEHRVPEEKYNKKGVLIKVGLIIVTLIFIVAMTLYRDLPYEAFTVYDKGMYITGFTIVLDAGLFYIVKTAFKNVKSKWKSRNNI